MTPSSSKTSPSRAALICTVFILLTSTSCTFGGPFECIKSVVSFGNSYADTGNALYLSKADPFHPGSPPYGETYFHHPTGRSTDGRLIIDFFSQYFGLPFVPPYFGPDGAVLGDFRQGVNFAVDGATALDFSYLAEKGIINLTNNISLSTELGWFKELLASSCPNISHSNDCKDLLQRSLFLLGEIGCNDAFYAIGQGKTIMDVTALFGDIIETIISTVKELIEFGAVNIMVAGQFPLGCVSYLSSVYSGNPQDYDASSGCVISVNKAFQLFNGALQVELEKIRPLYPHANIIYADYYNAAMQLFNSPEKYAITNTLDACCGGGGPYNYNESILCSDPRATVCDDPSSYVNWDGIHLTEAAYEVIAKGLLEGPYTIPQINDICSSKPLNGLAAS